MYQPYLELPRSIYLLCLGSFINRAGSLVAPFLALYLNKQLHFDAAFATAALGAFGVGSVIAALIGGQLADRIGRRAVMLIALAGSAAILIGLSFAREPAVILATIFAFSAVADMYRPAASAMVADLVPAASRPQAFALLYLSVNLGFAVGPVVGGLLSEISFQALFFADAATTLLFATIIFLRIPETLGRARAAATVAAKDDSASSVAPDGSSRADDARGERDAPTPSAARPTSGGGSPSAATRRAPHGASPSSAAPCDEAEASPSAAAALRYMLRDSVMMRLCLSNFLIAMVYMQAMSSFPLYLGSIGYSPADYGRIIALNGVLIVLFQIPLTAWAARRDRVAVLIASALLTGIGFGLHGAAAAGWQFAIAVTIWTLGEMLQAALLAPIVSELAPPTMRARYMGTISMTFAAAQMCGAPLGGLALGIIGAGVWPVCTVLGVCSAALFLGLRKRLARRASPGGPVS